MNWKDISRSLELMMAIVNEAKTSGEMSVLERDLLLETLRKCYASVRYPEAEKSADECAEVISPAEVIAVAAVAEEKMTEEVVAEEPTVEEVAVESVLEEPIEEPVEVEPAPVPEPTPEPEPAPEPEPEPAPEDSFISPVRHKLDRKTIRSLYTDDEPAQSAQVVAEDFYAAPVEESVESNLEIAEEESTPVIEKLPEPEQIIFIEEEEEEVSASSIFEITDDESNDDYDSVDELPFSFREVKEESAEEVAPTLSDAAPHLTVLGDVVGAERTTIADSISPKEDVASVIGSRQLSSLRGAIGLNDKFLLIRDLFGGDNSAYESAIDGLEACDSLDDAMLYIFDNFEWDVESDGAKLLTELLSRRFQ